MMDQTKSYHRIIKFPVNQSAVKGGWRCEMKKRAGRMGEIMQIRQHIAKNNSQTRTAESLCGGDRL